MEARRLPSPTATVAGPPYVDVGLPPLIRQFYVVTAVNTAAEEAPLGSFGSLPPAVETRTTAPPDATDPTHHGARFALR